METVQKDSGSVFHIQYYVFQPLNVAVWDTWHPCCITLLQWHHSRKFLTDVKNVLKFSQRVLNVESWMGGPGSWITTFIPNNISKQHQQLSIKSFSPPPAPPKKNPLRRWRWCWCVCVFGGWRGPHAHSVQTASHTGHSAGLLCGRGPVKCCSNTHTHSLFLFAGDLQSTCCCFSTGSFHFLWTSLVASQHCWCALQCQFRNFFSSSSSFIYLFTLATEKLACGYAERQCHTVKKQKVLLPTL